MKPKIYFKRYASGLGFWCVTGRPRDVSSKSREGLLWKKAYHFVSELNNPVRKED